MVQVDSIADNQTLGTQQADDAAASTAVDIKHDSAI